MLYVQLIVVGPKSVSVLSLKYISVGFPVGIISNEVVNPGPPSVMGAKGSKSVRERSAVVLVEVGRADKLKELVIGNEFVPKYPSGATVEVGPLMPVAV